MLFKSARGNGKQPDPPQFEGLTVGAFRSGSVSGAIDTLTATDISGRISHPDPVRSAPQVVLTNGYGSLRTPVEIRHPDVRSGENHDDAAGFRITLADLRFTPILPGLRVQTTFSIEADGQNLLSRSFWFSPEAARAGRYQWGLDEGDGAGVVGWIRDRFADYPVRIAVHNPATGAEASVTADLVRPGRGPDSGRCGFAVQVPLKVTLKSEVLSLVVIEGGERITLTHVGFPALIGEAQESPRAGFAEGWVLNRIDPSWRPSVQVLRLGEVVGAGRATMFRADLKKLTGEDGFFGFRIPLPAVTAASEELPPDGGLSFRASLPTGEALDF